MAGTSPAMTGCSRQAHDAAHEELSALMKARIGTATGAPSCEIYAATNELLGSKSEEGDRYKLRLPSRAVYKIDN
jgi:hypothetical protein